VGRHLDLDFISWVVNEIVLGPGKGKLINYESRVRYWNIDVRM
jgi:hypothetical protein